MPGYQAGHKAAALLLFGQAGSGIWASFSDSTEFADAAAHPMDRWSRRVGDELAQVLGGKALFPFEGPPWHPFGRWAQRTEAMQPSPLGILMHPEYGLWHAYRFAVALPGAMPEPSLPVAEPSHACDSCAARPCLQACPVNAFRDGAYDVAACANYLHDNAQAACHRLGCLARVACPEAGTFSYEPEHRQFHMRQFLASMK